MLSRRKVAVVTAVIAALVLNWTLVGTVVAQKASVPKPQDNLALGQEDVRQLLLLIGTDKNGKISKQEWMKFMEAEFDRLDVEKNGELDVKELAQSKLRVSHFGAVGK
jgi:EF hand